MLISEVVEVDSHLANTIEASFSSVVESNKQQGTGTTLVSRNWDRYGSDIPKANMTSSEAKLYDRLDAIASSYLLGTADALYIQRHNFYVTSGAKYGDLGLTKSEAYKVTEWFVYNNPQYYFLRPKFLIANSAFYMGVYDFAASGTERAALTNSVYDTLDKWIASCNDDEVTTYQKELSAHKLVCNNFSYQTSAYDQSIYSAVFYNKTVCAGYARVFQIICNASGIDCMTTLSNAHVWNIVKLDDGQWYVVDPTWNDSLNGYYVFNTDAASARKYDNNNEHVSDAVWTRWSPVIASIEYKPNMYDTTGSHDAPMTLSAPTNIAVDFTDGSSLVSWDSVSNATGYDVEIYNGLSLIGSSHVSAKHIYVNNVQQYGELQIKVRATAEIEGFTYTSDWADYTVYPEQVLQPYNINVELQNSTAIITWDGYEHRTYELEFYLDSAYTNFLASKSVSSHSLIINNIRDQYDYFGRIRTIRDNNGIVEKSGWVNFDIKRISSQPDIPSEPVPDIPSEQFSVGIPSDLSAEMIVDSSCHLTWDAGKNASYYEIKITNDRAGNSVLFSTVVYSQGAVFRNIVKTNNYYAYVRSVGVSDGQMYYSDWAFVTMYEASNVSDPYVPSEPDVPQVPDTPQIPDIPQVPDVPSEPVVSPPYNLVSEVNDNVCRVSWQGDCDRIEFQISIDGFSTVLFSSSVTGSNSMRLNNVVDGWSYSIRLRSVKNINGQDYYSDWAYSQF